MGMTDLWHCISPAHWRGALASYDIVVERQHVARLTELDRWYQTDLPHSIRSRSTALLQHDELVRVTEWKMSRGVWRAPNLVLVRSNTPEAVMASSADAFVHVPHPTQPIASLCVLAGVGPATASAVMAAFAPDTYPFFDELVAGQIPSLGAVAWTPRFYGRYAALLRERASALGDGWNASMIERALWANVGGKAAASTG